MKKPVWIGILFVIVVLGVIIYSSMNLASYRRTASGSTLEFAQRTAISNACADIASGVTDSIACEQSTPSKLTRLK
jgi:hypothetical protein